MDNRIDMFADGACVYQLDNKGNHIRTLAWATSDLTARAAFNEQRSRNPDERVILKRRAFVLAEHEPEKPAGTETLTIRLSPDIASAVRGYSIARDQAPGSIAAELIETALSALGVIDGDVTTDRLTRFSLTDGEA